MTNEAVLEQLHKRYREGLTGIFAIGGTRTTYILEQNRRSEDPGKIDDFDVQSAYLMQRYLELAGMFFEMGGQNMIINVFSFRGFHNRGQEYGDVALRNFIRIIQPEAQAFYLENGIDPYIAGIEPMLLYPKAHPLHQMAEELHAFQQTWSYQKGRRRLVWEMVGLPFLSFWQIFNSMPAEQRAVVDDAIARASEDDLDVLYRKLYQIFALRVYGTDIPLPHFYLGTNKGGDLKLRSTLPLALTGGEHMRMFFTPYPSLLITRESLAAIIEELAYKDRFHSTRTDYTGQYTTDLVEREYQRAIELSSNPASILGFTRHVE